MGDDEKFAVDANDRVLDPVVLSQIGAGRNMSSGTDAATLKAFGALWARVNRTRDSLAPDEKPTGGNFTGRTHFAGGLECCAWLLAAVQSFCRISGSFSLVRTTSVVVSGRHSFSQDVSGPAANIHGRCGHAQAGGRS
jgi:hypothetical protein